MELQDVQVAGGRVAADNELLRAAPVRRGGSLLRSTALDIGAAFVILMSVYKAGSLARSFVAHDAMLYIAMPRESSFAIAKPNASLGACN